MLSEIRDTRASLWISASAGTGKTKSLIDRILALLLDGAIPSHILCLTYTKAAATEMLERLNSYFTKTDGMSDAEVIQELINLGFSEKYLSRVRELSKQVLQQDWVKIQTIHSFAFSIIQKFPLETALLPGVKQCEDYQKTQLLNEAFRAVVQDKKLEKHLKNIARYTLSLVDLLKDHTLMLLRKFLSKYPTDHDIEKFFSIYFDVSPEILQLPYDDAIDQFVNSVMTEDYRNKLTMAIKLLDKSDKSTSANTKNLLMTMLDGNFSESKNLIYTADGKPRKTLYTKDVDTPALHDALQTIKFGVEKYIEYENGLRSAHANISLFIVLKNIAQYFHQQKKAQHIIDFDDMILETIELLKNNFDWVMYKIDQGIDHVLVDEAQDTSPDQWRIIELITEDFFAVAQSQKTIFIVGDEKQSIYSFQGADVSLFNKMHARFERKATECGQKFYTVKLNTSYRSDGAILKFVDDVLASDFPGMIHVPSKNENKGIVEIATFEKNSTALPEYIAQLIDDAIRNQLPVKNYSRGAQPQDFLILFRHRDLETMNKICEALHNRKIPVSGVDRVLLKDELIVEDLIALAQFVENPLDDLTCARVLKSPIVGMSEDDLMQLCLARENQYLWHFVLKNSKIFEKYNLQSLLEYTKLKLSSYNFFETVLLSGVKEKLIQHFGGRCVAMLNEFLNVCYNYEQQSSPLLSDFLRWFRNFDQTIKKEYNGNRNEVKLMTAHSSKGLQAPFVIIADAHFLNNKGKTILHDNENLFWNFDSSRLPKAVQQILDHEKNSHYEESMRLLYVAMTRAETYLHIFGEAGTGQKSWHKKVLQSSLLKSLQSSNDEIQKFGFGEYESCDFQKIADEKFHEEEITIPEWYYQKFPDVQNYENIEKQSNATIFGDCVHSLLRKVCIYQDDLKIMADSIVDSFDLNDADKQCAIETAMKVYQKLPKLFNESAKSEVSFFFEGKEGRIDHVVQIDDEVWIIDWKTGEPIDPIPDEYKNQLRFYQRAYENLLNIRARIAIVWTKNQNLIEVQS